MNIQYIHPADQLVMFMQRIYDKGLTTMSGGNLSIRDTQGNIWITPAGIDKGTLTRKDIICVRPDGSCEGPHKPSSELPFHESVYRMRPDLNAVLHAHPPALVAFSIVRKLPDLDLIPSVRHICEQMKIATYAVPGSEALGVEIGKVFRRAAIRRCWKTTAFASARRICSRRSSALKRSTIPRRLRCWPASSARSIPCPRTPTT